MYATQNTDLHDHMQDLETTYQQFSQGVYAPSLEKG
jgi:hypothetical protein